ncbi:peroxiredoxin, partial [Micromonospora maritima]|uniref:peroxiredoxin n=1 Tax=Micromonospora maritima TaxID=986711 RepID=UPI0024840F6C
PGRGRRRASSRLAREGRQGQWCPPPWPLDSTAESCHFRDLAAEFAAVGASRVGISRDPVDRQAEFSRRHGFDYPLLSDVDGAVAEAFGVRRRLPLGALSTRRMTFVIGPDRRVLAVVHSELSMNEHADAALRALGG